MSITLRTTVAAPTRHAANRVACPRPARRATHVARARNPEVQLNGAMCDGLINEDFAEVLKHALARNPAAKYELSAATESMDEHRHTDLSRASLEVLQAALVTSRQSLNRLVGQQSALEAEIATQQKQVQRLEFVLDKVRRDYSFLNTVQKLRAQEQARAGDLSGARR